MIVRFEFDYYDEKEHKIEKKSGIVEAETLGYAVDHVVEFMLPIKINEISVYECEGLLFNFELKDLFQ